MPLQIAQRALEILENRVDAQLLRFLLVGAFNTFATLAIYSSIVFLSDKVKVGVIFSAICGIIISSFLNSSFTFKRSSIVHMVTFSIVYMFTVSINIFILVYMVDVMSFNKYITQIFLAPSIAVLTFLLLRITDHFYSKMKRV